MTTDSIQYTQDDNGIGILRFNRPHALNALNLAAMREFQELIIALEQDKTLRVLILTGAGHAAFCSGGDLVELSQYPDEDSARDFIGTMGAALLRLERLPIPVIAAINGYALGGGSEIAVACDLRIVDDAVKMGFVQISMGLTPGWGAGQRLLRIVGYSKALELLLRGTVLRAPELQSLGLANQVTAQGKAFETALELAQAISQQAPDVVRGIKTLLQAGLNQPYETALATEQALFPPLWSADAHLQAVAAFLQRQSAKKSSS